MYYLLLLIGIAFNVAAQVTLKLAMNGHQFVGGQTILGYLGSFVGNYLLWVSLSLYGIGFLLYAIVLSKLELSTTYPAASTLAIILTVFLSVALMHESLSIYKVAGLAFCLMGVFILFR